MTKATKAKPRRKSVAPLKYWMLNSAHHVASILPPAPDEALVVLALAEQIIRQVNPSFIARVRGAAKG